jgi:hypothetical protein
MLMNKKKRNADHTLYTNFSFRLDFLGELK